MFLLLLYECGLIQSNEYNPNLPIEVTKVGSNNTDIEKFLEDYSAALDTPEKTAAFLEGVLVRKLLDIQYAQRNSTPFRSKLRGLRLDVDKLKSLLGEIENKLAAYDRGYPSLMSLTSNYMLEAESKGWDISRNELTYFFTLGMNLGRAF
jgi:CRISPR-associated protein Csh1